MSKTESIVRVGIAYILAFGAADAWLAWGPRTSHLWLDGLIADLIATLVVFVASRLHRNSSFYDAYWSVLPPLLMIAWWVRIGTDASGVRAWLVLGVVVLWAIRLTGNWLYAFPGLPHEDWRYPLLRDGAGKAEGVVDLMAIHVFPTLEVFAGMLPVYVVLTSTGRGIGWLDIVACVIGVGAVILEFTADLQMYRFAAHRRPGQAMDQGLWSLVAAPELLRRVRLLARPGPVRPGRRATRLVVAVPRDHHHVRDVPGREHPDDGKAQPRTQTGLPGRDRPDTAFRSAPPRRRAA